eukprot:164021-Rhodomonas_salina.1
MRQCGSQPPSRRPSLSYRKGCSIKTREKKLLFFGHLVWSWRGHETELGTNEAGAWQCSSCGGPLPLSSCPLAPLAPLAPPAPLPLASRSSCPLASAEQRAGEGKKNATASSPLCCAAHTTLQLLRGGGFCACRTQNAMPCMKVFLGAPPLPRRAALTLGHGSGSGIQAYCWRECEIKGAKSVSRTVLQVNLASDKLIPGNEHACLCSAILTIRTHKAKTKTVRHCSQQKMNCLADEKGTSQYKVSEEMLVSMMQKEKRREHSLKKDPVGLNHLCTDCRPNWC